MKNKTEYFDGQLTNLPNIAQNMQIVGARSPDDLINKLREIRIEYTVIQFYASNSRHFCVVAFGRKINKRKKTKKISE